MEFCETGQHPSLEAFHYDGKTHCPEHLPEPGPPDQRDPGWCEIGRGHWAADTVFLPSRGKRWCIDHFSYNVREYLRRGGWR